MEQKLVLHPAIHEPRSSDIIIELTDDIQLHTNARITQSVSNTLKRSVESNQPGRIFSPIDLAATVLEDDTIIFSMSLFDPNQMESLVRHYQQQGRRVFIKKPKNWTPPSLGKDSVEFLNSKQGKRVLRKFEKDQQAD